MSDLHNESIFITGGGSGLGLALVERFIEEGAQVATLELSAAKVASLRQRFGEHILAVEGSPNIAAAAICAWLLAFSQLSQRCSAPLSRRVIATSPPAKIAG